MRKEVKGMYANDCCQGDEQCCGRDAADLHPGVRAGALCFRHRRAYHAVRGALVRRQPARRVPAFIRAQLPRHGAGVLADSDHS